MENSKIGMHSLLVKLGKDIVRKQFDEPGQRQFFVDSGENCEVLLADEATLRCNMSNANENQQNQYVANDDFSKNKPSFSIFTNDDFFSMDASNGGMYHKSSTHINLKL
ncbi:unnamed protein product [Arabidopsis lyrata]|uniref:Predicted protein n=1 Tax=Arabidopsis lyrata subsp. lyrata TaxID=81972 RepID=D7MXA3_ARALL|nr:predicted protein [Arabidopsis lyrata subsp. lyrata]CAH8261957.1 unnamed protein product [Arabidopsis lyrata]